MGYIKDRIGEAAMYEQLAEEAAELCKAALKMARILRDENPTPVKREGAAGAIEEEYTDVMVCASELGITINPTLESYKRKRFVKRWEEHEKHERREG